MPSSRPAPALSLPQYLSPRRERIPRRNAEYVPILKGSKGSGTRPVSLVRALELNCPGPSYTPKESKQSIAYITKVRKERRKGQTRGGSQSSRNTSEATSVQVDSGTGDDEGWNDAGCWDNAGYDPWWDENSRVEDPQSVYDNGSLEDIDPDQRDEYVDDLLQRAGLRRRKPTTIPKRRTYRENVRALKKNWDDFVRAVTAEFATLSRGCLPCKCSKEIAIPALSFFGTPSLLALSYRAGWTLKSFVICEDGCRYKAAMPGLLCEKYYPSSPVNPTFALHEDVLEFFHELRCSKSRFCRAFQTFVERRKYTSPGSKCPTSTLIPKAAYDNFRYLYPSWLDIRSIVSETVEAQLSAPTDVESQDVYKRLSVGDAGDDLALGRIPLKRLCPACFGDLAKRSCVCFDANFQNKAVWVGGEAATVDGGTAMGEAEIKIMARDTRDRRLTVDDEIGSESKQISPKKRKAPTSEDDPDPCLNFKAATNPKVSALFKHHGLVVATCRHDIPLRLFNIQGTGERLSYAHTLLEDIMKSPDCPDKLTVFYDIACTFAPYLKSRMSYDNYQRLDSFCLNVFHMYNHALPCQLQFSPRNHEGLGLPDGESPERCWSDNRHIIPSCRVASDYIRRQIITDSFLTNAEEKRNCLPQAILRGFKAAGDKQKDTSKVMENCFAAVADLDHDSLQRQSKLMEDFYLSPKSSVERFRNDQKIFETLNAIKVQYEYFEMIIDQPNFVQTARQEMGEAIPARAALADKLEKLLSDVGQTIDMWIANGDITERYREHEERDAVRQFSKVRDELWKALAQRTFQLERLHGSSTHGLHQPQLIVELKIGTRKAETEIRSVKACSERIRKLIDKYNDLIDKLPVELNGRRPSRLDKKKFKEITLNDQLWEHEIFQRDELWAFNPQVRQAISALHLNRRCYEEVPILVVEFENYMNWIVPRLAAIDKFLNTTKLDSLAGVHLRELGMQTADSLRPVIDMKYDIRWADSTGELKKKLKELEQRALAALDVWQASSLRRDLDAFSISATTDERGSKTIKDIAEDVELQVEMLFAEDSEELGEDESVWQDEE